MKEGNFFSLLTSELPVPAKFLKPSERPIIFVGPKNDFFSNLSEAGMLEASERRRTGVTGGSLTYLYLLGVSYYWLVLLSLKETPLCSLGILWGFGQKTLLFVCFNNLITLEQLNPRSEINSRICDWRDFALPPTPLSSQR